jgi:hypothetical protein
MLIVFLSHAYLGQPHGQASGSENAMQRILYPLLSPFLQSELDPSEGLPSLALALSSMTLARGWATLAPGAWI